MHLPLSGKYTGKLGRLYRHTRVQSIQKSFDESESEWNDAMHINKCA